MFVAGTWVPDVMPFALNPSAPLDVIAPHPRVPTVIFGVPDHPPAVPEQVPVTLPVNAPVNVVA